MQEVSGLATAFSNTSHAFENGLTVGGDKFFAIRADERSIYGKKVSRLLGIWQPGQS